MPKLVVQLTDDAIDAGLAFRQLQSAKAGAVVVFLGTTRELTRGRQTTRLKYEAYAPMAEQKLAELEREARRKWPIVECLLVHRLGWVELSEASVLVGVCTPHRREAFAASEWLMDQIKQEVPIWKQEHWADGANEWVHPGWNNQPADRPVRESSW